MLWPWRSIIVFGKKARTLTWTWTSVFCWSRSHSWTKSSEITAAEGIKQKKKNKQKAQKLWIWNREITIQHFCFLYRGQSGATNDMMYYGDEGRATCHCHIIVALSYFFVSIEVWCSNAAAAVWPHHIAHIHPHHLCWIYSWKTFRGRPYAPFYTHRPIATATITHIQITNRFWAVALLAPAFPRFHSEQQRPKF